MSGYQRPHNYQVATTQLQEAGLLAAMSQKVNLHGIHYYLWPYSDGSGTYIIYEIVSGDQKGWMGKLHVGNDIQLDVHLSALVERLLAT